MERLPIEENARERARLSQLADRLSDDDLARDTGDGWTVGVLLAQLAFWDRWAEHLIHRWRSGQMPPPTVPEWYDAAINASLLPEWRSLDPRRAAGLAVEAAERVDREIEHAETPVIAGILAAHEGNLIDRFTFRATTLDKIEKLF